MLLKRQEEKIVNINMELPRELHHMLRVQAAIQGITLKELITDELARHFGKLPEKNHSIKNK